MASDAFFEFLRLCRPAHGPPEALCFEAFVLSLNPIKHWALAELRCFGDCYFVLKIISISKFMAKDACYKYNNE